MWSRSAEILNPYEEILGKDPQAEVSAQKNNLVQQTDAEE